MDHKLTHEELKQKLQDLEDTIKVYNNKELALHKKIGDLEQISKYYYALMENTEDAILISDNHGKPQAFNSSYKRKIKELLGLDMRPGIQPHTLLNDTDAKKYWDSLHQRVLTGEKFRSEYTHVINDDVVIHFETTFCPIVEKDEITGFTEVTRDISDRKQAEERLRYDETLLRHVLDTSPAVIFVKDRDSTILLANKKMASFYNLSVEEVTGRRQSDLHAALGVYQKEVEAWLVDDRDVIDTGMIKHLLETGTDSSNRILWFETDKYPIDIGEGRRGVLVISDDITERKQAEESLKQANETLEKRVTERTAELKQRAEQLQQLALDLTKAEDLERRHLAAILHDDFQQDAACIKMELDRLSGRADTDMRHRLANLAQFTGECIEKMRHLSYTLNPPALHRSGLLAALNVLAKDMQTHHGLAVTLRTQAGAEPVSSTLSSMLYRSVRELLFNVVKHAGVNTAVVDVIGRDKWIRIKVTDHGNGFDYPAVRDGQGSEAGFGLYNIEDRMSFLGGSMHIESRPGKGSCIVLTAPKGILPDSTALEERGRTAAIKQSKAPEPAKPHAMSDDKKQIRILLVEDHKLFRKGLVEMLRDHKELVVVGEADDGEKAIELAGRLRPNVILMDITMPKLDGVEATARITQNHPDIRIIGLSMHNDNDTRQKMLNVGAEAFLAKTVSPDKLIETIRRVHRGFNRSNGSAGQKNKRG
jgi:PAS domain S-box-containing protein